MIGDIDVEAARDRDGEAGERPDDVDDLLEWKQVGYEVGEPLAAESYSQYPDSRAELSAPKYAEFLKRLFRSPAINGYDDAVTEVNGPTDSLMRRKWRETLQNAADAAGLDAGQLLSEGNETACGGPGPALTALTAELPKHIVSEDNPLCLTFLYAEKGLSVGEIADVFQTDERAIRARLHDVGLVIRREDRPDGKTVEDIMVNPPEGDGEPVRNPTVNVNTEAIAKDEHVTVERDEE